jgi:Protein of unknown function (DUF3105)
MSNRGERERLRQQRLAQQQSQGSSDRRRMVVGYATAGILAVAVLAGLVLVITGGGGGGGGGGTADTSGCDNAHIGTGFGFFRKDFNCDNRKGTTPPELQFGDLKESADKAGCELHLDLSDEGHNHFTDETKGTYKTNPPTSGDHFAAPDQTGTGALAEGAYLGPIPESRLVHAMEHGRVEIRYSPDLPEADQLALKGVFDEDSTGVILVKDPDLPYAVAVSAWTNYVGCKNYDPIDLDVVRNFRDAYRGNGPENIPY